MSIPPAAPFDPYAATAAPDDAAAPEEAPAAAAPPPPPSADAPARPAIAAAPPPDFGTIDVGGHEVPRAGPPQTPLNGAQVETLKLALKGLDFAPTSLGYKDWRSADTAAAAVATPPVSSKSGDPQPFGPLTIVKPGGSNFTPSPAYLFRAAQYSGKLVLAYQNASDPSKNTLRPVDEIQGVPVPDSLRGKIFAIGSEDPAVVSIEQASDNFVAELGQMEQQKDMLGVDPLSAHATVLSHSEGCADAVLTRRRLDEAGLGGAIGKLVTVGSGVGIGSLPVDPDAPPPPVEQAFAIGVRPVLKALGNAPGADTQKDIIGQYRRLFPPGTDQLVDLSVAGRVGGPAHLRPRLGIPPFRVDDPNNVKPGIRAFIAGSPLIGEEWTPENILGALHGSSDDSDGMIPNEASRCGKQFLMLAKPHDHTGLVEDPAVIDEIVKAI
jgi:hypothetical protein